jgi:hypothetical protein
MTEYQCWFCGEGIARSDLSAVMIGVQNIWRWESGVVSDDDPYQAVYAHSHCTKDRMRGATMSLDPSTFLEAE